ncbi:caspase family protein [bacterium]|nr:caspase family protein [bacterium]MBU1983283.1 caspase family protein [bacterium]
MTRGSVIFGYPGELGQEDYCPGVLEDIEGYRRFLTSPNGGLWSENEIQQLTNASSGDVNRAIDRLEHVDYGLVVFSGHGSFASRTNTTVLQINRTSEIDHTELLRGAQRQTLILDCCRQPDERIVLEESIKKSAAAYVLSDASRCRVLFDESILACAPSRVVLYSCRISQVSIDTPAGGLYSFSLVRHAMNWAARQGQSRSVLSTVAAHNTAAITVGMRSNGTQTPVAEKPRSEPYFPFCVSA